MCVWCWNKQNSPKELISFFMLVLLLFLLQTPFLIGISSLSFSLFSQISCICWACGSQNGNGITVTVVVVKHSRRVKLWIQLSFKQKHHNQQNDNNNKNKSSNRSRCRRRCRRSRFCFVLFCFVLFVLLHSCIVEFLLSLLLQCRNATNDGKL